MIKQLREKLGLTQEVFYAKIGVDQRRGSYWESKAKSVPADAIHRICNAYRVTQEEIFGSAKIGGPQPDIIPVIGYVSAGETSVEYDDQGYPVGSGFDDVERPGKVKDAHAYALRVKGDSMEPVYREGDTIILDTTKPVHDKDEAIVRLRGKAYFKIFRQMMGRITLQSFNREHPEIPCDPQDIEFAHRVVLIEPAERDLQDPLIGPALRHVYGSPAKDKAAGAITTPEEVPSPKAASDARPGVPGDTKTERFHGKKGRKK